MSDLCCRSESNSSGGYLHMFSCGWCQFKILQCLYVALQLGYSRNMSDLYCRSESDSSGGYLHMFSCDRSVLLDSRNNANQVCLLVRYLSAIQT